MAGFTVVAALAAAAAVGVVRLTLVDLLVLLGVSVVLPLALPRGWSWSVAASTALGALVMPTGAFAAALAVPLIVVATATLVTSARNSREQRNLCGAAQLAAAGYVVVASMALLCSRLGSAPFAIREPIVELTAVHFMYAGVGALALAAGFLEHSSGWRLTVARLSTVLVAAAPVVVATGFITHSPLPQIGGAVLLTFGVWLTATLELAAVFDRVGRVPARALQLVSAVAVWIPMVLAVAWATGQHWDVPALSIDAMVRTHGVVNALAFVVAGLVGTGSAFRG